MFFSWGKADTPPPKLLYPMPYAHGGKCCHLPGASSFSPSDFTFKPLLLVFRSHFWKVGNMETLIVVSYHWVVKWWRIFFLLHIFWYFLNIKKKNKKKTLCSAFLIQKKRTTRREKERKANAFKWSPSSPPGHLSLLPHSSPASWKHLENRAAKSSAPHSAQHLTHSSGPPQNSSVSVCWMNEYSGNI